MREIEKGRTVEIIGYPTFEYENGAVKITLRINLDVVYIGEVRNEIN